MTMSDDERRLLAEMARRLEEQDPELASALHGWSGPTAGVGWPRRVAARWHNQVLNWQQAPLRAAVAGGMLTFALLLMAGHLSQQPAPDPGAQSVAETFTEQIPQP